MRITDKDLNAVVKRRSQPGQGRGKQAQSLFKNRTRGFNASPSLGRIS